MAVRSFNGTSTDFLRTGVGATNSLTFGTAAAIVRFGGTGGTFQGILEGHDSGGTLTGIPLGVTSANKFHWYTASVPVEYLPVTFTLNNWYLVVVRKDTGTVTPRFSIYDFVSTTWSHGAGEATTANITAPGVGGTWRFDFQNTNDWFNGMVAARALWSNAVHWTADAAGDTAIEGAGLHTALQNWDDENPDALWAFNQESVATPVTDLTGNGADQTSIGGTTVVTGSDPPGFDFTLSGPSSSPAPNLFLTRNLQNR